MTNLSEILSEVDIEDWLETQGIDYRKGAAGQFNLENCPFCNGSKWKVYMRCDDGRGKCFSGSCQQGFNLFSFARAYLGTDSRGTALHFESYANGAGIVTSTPKTSPAIVTPDTCFLPLSTPLPTPEGQTHPFLVERRITLATQARFGLRYCDVGAHKFTDHNGEAKITDFSQRIIIPVEDTDGEIKTFQGRDITGESEKRYLFPAMLPGTGRFLYGASFVGGRKHLIICEGPFDVMATYQAIDGIPEFREYGAIGSFGLSIGSGNEDGDDQLGRLRKFKRAGTEMLTFLWDGEEGAFKQALKYGQKLRSEGFKVRVGMLPRDKDPADVDTETVREAIRNAKLLDDTSLMRYMLRNPYA